MGEFSNRLLRKCSIATNKKYKQEENKSKKKKRIKLLESGIIFLSSHK